jgi:hypothetical protein
MLISRSTNDGVVAKPHPAWRLTQRRRVALSGINGQSLVGGGGLMRLA